MKWVTKVTLKHFHIVKGIIHKHMYYLIYTTVPFKSLGYLFFFGKEINTFIQQRCINLIKSDSKDIYCITKEFYYKKSCSFEFSIHQKILKKKKIQHSLHKNINTSMLELFVKDHVTLKTGVMVAVNSALPLQAYILYIIYCFIYIYMCVCVCVCVF